MSAEPARLDLNGRPGQAARIQCGRSWRHTITFLENGAPVDKSGSDFLAQLRMRPDDEDVLVAFTTMVSGVDSNDLTFSLTDTETETLRPYIGAVVYDLREDDGSQVVGRLEGTALIRSDVSRSV